MKDTPKHHEIYTQKVTLYDQLIAYEDYRKELPKTLTTMLRPNGKDILELGVGTGRLAQMLIPHCRSYVGFDAYSQMLVKAEKNCKTYHVIIGTLMLQNTKKILFQINQSTSFSPVGV